MRKTRSWQSKLKAAQTRRRNGTAQSNSFNGATGKRIRKKRK